MKVGDLVELNCTVTAEEPLPLFFTVTTSSQSSMKNSKVVDIILPTGEKRKGMQMLQRRVKLSDNGQFTCVAHWNDHKHTEKDMYRLNITGDFLLSVYIVQYLKFYCVKERYSRLRVANIKALLSQKLLICFQSS